MLTGHIQATACMYTFVPPSGMLITPNQSISLGRCPRQKQTYAALMASQHLYNLYHLFGYYNLIFRDHRTLIAIGQDSPINM